MKNLKTIYHDNAHPHWNSLQSVISSNGNGVYIIVGFEEEYAEGISQEVAILLINGSDPFIISPSRGILKYNGRIWKPVTRLASEKIPLADLAEGVMKSDPYWLMQSIQLPDEGEGSNGRYEMIETIWTLAKQNGCKETNHPIFSFTGDLLGSEVLGIGVLSGMSLFGFATSNDDRKLYSVYIDGDNMVQYISPILTGIVTTDKIADKAVTRAILDDAVVGQIDKFQVLPENTNLLSSSIAEGVYLVRGYKYQNFPQGFYTSAPSLLIVGEYDRLLIGRDNSSSGYPIIARKTSGMTTWSASPVIHNELASKQNSTDNTLTTTSKTIVGAINELQSSLGNISSVLTNIIGE